MTKKYDPDYVPVVDETINIYSSTVLPPTTFNDPKAIDSLVNKAFHQNKVGIDEMSTSINKMRLDPRIIIAIAIFVPIGLMLFYQGVIAPAQNAENDYKIKLAQHGGNVSAVGPPPKGVGEILRLPGFSAPR